MSQLLLWEEEEKAVEQWIEIIHFGGKREIVSTLDPTVNWQDTTVWSAEFVVSRNERERGLR